MAELQGGCRLHKGRIVGWARDPDFDGNIDIVATIDNGVLVYQGTANIFRPDLKEKCIGDGRFGFNFSIPSRTFDPNTAIHIRQLGTDSAVPGSPIILNGESIKLAGGCRIQKGNVIGWAKLPDSDTPVTLKIATGDGEFIWRGMAKLYRADLKEKGIGDGNHGFACQIPAHLLDSRFFLHVREVCSGKELPNSPLEIEDSFIHYRKRLLAILSPPIWGVVDSHEVNIRTKLDDRWLSCHPRRRIKQLWNIR